MLRAVVLQRQALAVSAVLAAALACWVVTYRDATMMGGLGPFVEVWATSTAAMMLPAAAPMVIAYSGIGHARRSTPVFVLGYLALWTALGLVAYPVGQELSGWSRAGGAGLLLAGLYQLTRLKDVCLRRCRAPLGFVVRRWRDGRLGALAMGVEHGAWCSGCCAGLMVALFALGMASLAWMAAVALLILAEKSFPRGDRLARAAGLALVVAGVAVLA